MRPAAAQADWATGDLIDGAAGAAGHCDWVRSVATAVVDGREVAVIGGDEAVSVWDPATGEPFRNIALLAPPVA